ncbi:Hypothetical protein SCF082_LOCUS44148 [Durusdinium trenchii]
MADSYQPLLNAEVVVANAEAIEFTWNTKQCKGNELHFAALQGDLQEVIKILSKRDDEKATKTLQKAPKAAEICNSRFTFPMLASEKDGMGGEGKLSQLQLVEGTGQAIHLAASRGHLEVVKELLASKASLTDSVTRDGHEHYDVLFAALFGAHEDMIQFILSQVPADPQLDKNLKFGARHPLHVAFQVGSPSIVLRVRRWMLQSNVTETDLALSSKCKGAPLKYGIDGRRMKLQDLILCADTTALSLRVFMSDCPRAVPLFLKRLQKLSRVNRVLEEANITSRDVGRLLEQCSPAALSILEACTVVPAYPHEYPLPSEVNFAPHDWPELIWNLLNRGDRTREVLTFLEVEKEWTFDEAKHKSPSWHDKLVCAVQEQGWLRLFLPPSGGIADAEICVCLIPDLLTPDVFAALASAETDLNVFANRTVAYMIAHVFENYAGKISMIRSMMSSWALILLACHSWSTRHLDSDEELPEVALVAVRFLSAQGIVDLTWESMEFFGWWCRGEPGRYFQAENASDWLSALVLTYFWINPRCRLVLVLTILISWLRLTRVAGCCAPIGRELVPFTRLFWGLGPVLYIAYIAFGAYSHAFFSLQGGDIDLSLYSSFVMLITAGMPGQPKEDPLECILLVLAVAVFTVIVLNIFIGVIGEQYSRLKEESVLSFRQQRAQICLGYMIRKPFIRFDCCSHLVSRVVILTSVILGVALQVHSAWYGSYFPELEGVVYTLLLVLMLTTAFQSPLALPKCSSSPSYEPGKFFWFCCQAEDQMADTELQELTIDFE